MLTYTIGVGTGGGGTGGMCQYFGSLIQIFKIDAGCLKESRSYSSNHLKLTDE